MARMSCLHAKALTALLECDPDRKCAAARTLLDESRRGSLRLEDAADPTAEAIAQPGRPVRPALVAPQAVERRKVSTPEGRAALIHALAHIEFNAINLALDAVYRFRRMPVDYYGDWLKVAAEEAYHFTMLRDHLRALGRDYGSFTAHNGLWEMAQKTAHDVLVRMALVPRVLEARGLDVAPALIRKLESCGDARAAAILAIIQRDEVEHVRIGNHWYRRLCAERGLEPVETFRRLLREYDAPRLRRPFDVAARSRAGFSAHELALFEELAAPD